jgi:hypothetical protein
MSVDVHEIDSEGLVGHSADLYAEAAVASAKALIEFDRSQERWVMPLVGAILRKRLRLPSLSPTTRRVVRLIESAEVDLEDLLCDIAADAEANLEVFSKFS